MKGKYLYKIRLITAGIVFLLALSGILGVFYPLKVLDFQFLPVVQRVFADFSVTALVILLILAAITFFFGRIYCSVICPFGILQEIFGFVKSLFKKNSAPQQKNFPLKYFITAAVWGVFIGGSSLVIRYFDPYSIFGSAFSGAVLGIALVVIILFAVLLKDRIFCTNFCPVGTILGVISQLSPNKIYMDENCVSCGMCEKNCPSGCINAKDKKVDNETCIKCFKCLSVCPENAMKYGFAPKMPVSFNLKRRQVIISGVVLAIFGGMAKAGIDLKNKISEKIKDVILPPGAGDKEKFLNKCLNCNLCVENCPNKIIKKADKEYGAVYLDYSNGYCDYNCAKCGEVCPSGAIKRLPLKEKQRIRIGMAMINENNCNQCGLCIETCPVHAITKINGKTVLDTSRCIGCGACRNVCKFNAIDVYTIKEQRVL